jgi:hypothetical protein
MLQHHWLFPHRSIEGSAQVPASGFVREEARAETRLSIQTPSQRLSGELSGALHTGLPSVELRVSSSRDTRVTHDRFTCRVMSVPMSWNIESCWHDEGHDGMVVRLCDDATISSKGPGRNQITSGHRRSESLAAMRMARVHGPVLK